MTDMHSSGPVCSSPRHRPFCRRACAAVAADTVEAAEEALDLIEVEYEELPAVFDAEEAMKPNPSVVLHPTFSNFLPLNFKEWTLRRHPLIS